MVWYSKSYWIVVNGKRAINKHMKTSGAANFWKLVFRVQPRYRFWSVWLVLNSRRKRQKERERETNRMIRWIWFNICIAVWVSLFNEIIDSISEMMLKFDWHLADWKFHWLIAIFNIFYFLYPVDQIRSPKIKSGYTEIKCLFWTVVPKLKRSNIII